MQRSFVLLSALILLFGTLFFPVSLVAAPFYEGKMVTLLIGTEPGGGTDRLGRLIAKHISKFIPGKPTVIIKNMSGAGGLVPSNYIYSAAKPDGLTFGTFNRGIIFSQLLQVKGVKFDMTKYSWLGSAATETTLLAIRSDLPYKTYEDLKKAKEPIIMGTQFPGTNTYDNASVFQHVLGLKMKLVTGYASSTEIMLAIERKEADGVALAYSALQPYVERGLVRLVFRTKAAVPGTEKVPVINDLTNDEMSKRILSMLAVTDFVGRPYVAPPNVPADRMKILREAFAKVIKDREANEEAKRLKLDLQYLSAEAALKEVRYFLNQPPETVKEFTRYIKPN